MSKVINDNDPRVLRTRQLIIQAFMSLMQEKRNIHSISIQEITERATINRATFYAHFEDKYALVESWMRGKFQQTLARQLPATSTLQRETLRMLILAVFEFLALVRTYARPANNQFEPLYEKALREELYDLLLKWFKQVPPSEPAVSEEAKAVTALVISWAILGPAAEWSRGDQGLSPERMTNHVLKIVIAGLSPIVNVT